MVEVEEVVEGGGALELDEVETESEVDDGSDVEEVSPGVLVGGGGVDDELSREVDEGVGLREYHQRLIFHGCCHTGCKRLTMGAGRVLTIGWRRCLLLKEKMSIFQRICADLCAHSTSLARSRGNGVDLGEGAEGQITAFGLYRLNPAGFPTLIPHNDDC